MTAYYLENFLQMETFLKQSYKRRLKKIIN